ncbi:hypothetical protein EC991_006252 [Linnemannia zychae]|nr:hypothetical protein EC991_006252 [Linnemannia zychae]
MPSVTGRFQIAAAGTNFQSKFTIDEVSHSFQGSLGAASIDACVGSVTLTYERVGQLTSARDFSGVIGQTKVKITLDNGVEISGPLENPISIANTVTGSGKWAVSESEKLIDFDPKKRMDVAEIKDDAFFTSGVCPSELSQDAFDEAPIFALLDKHSRDLVRHDDHDDNGPAELAEAEEQQDLETPRLQPLSSSTETRHFQVKKKSGAVVEAVPEEVNNGTEQPLHKVTPAAEVSERQNREYEE